MRCKNCKTLLSFYDVDRNAWKDDIEEFIIVCPHCKTETKLVSYLFEYGHITNPFLEMLVEDSDNDTREKNLNYIPQKQRVMLLEHLKYCDVCSDKMEQIRLLNLSHSLLFNKDTYDFFMSRAKDINQEIKCEFNCVGLKSFVFEGVFFSLSKKDLFFAQNQLWCYFLEQGSCSIGMASFRKFSNKVILEKIWLKSNQRIIKERQFIQELSFGTVRDLLETSKSS